MPSASSTEQSASKRERNNASKRRYYLRNRAEIIEKSRAWRERNRVVLNEKSRNYWRDNPEKREAANKKKRPPRSADVNHQRNLRHKYRMSVADYNAMFQEQEGRCAICLKHQSELKRRLHVDHCHATGVIRGLLCQHCNNILGLLCDDASALQRAVSYLQKVRE